MTEMLDRQLLDSAKFIHTDKSIITINDMAKKNNINVETLKDQIIKMILDGIIIYEGIDEGNYPILRMK